MSRALNPLISSDEGYPFFLVNRMSMSSLTWYLPFMPKQSLFPLPKGLDRNFLLSRTNLQFRQTEILTTKETAINPFDQCRVQKTYSFGKKPMLLKQFMLIIILLLKFSEINDIIQIENSKPKTKAKPIN